MWFYHERYHDAYYGEAALEDLRSRDPRDGDQSCESIRIPAILNWLVIVGVALCGIVTTIDGLS